MSETLADAELVGDAELISAVRDGDVSAYGRLFERHVASARRLARQLTSQSDADDLVSDAFTKVLRVLQNGGGPDVAFRAYLLTAIRRLHVDKIRGNARLQTTDDMEAFDPGVPFRDTAIEGFENEAAAKAFASLPERWQLVLWHTEVEGQKPAEVAAILGMSPNSVSALAYRAREGLRQAFLTSHAQEIEDDGCRWANDHLGGYIRKGLSRRDTAKVEAHLDECRRCMAIYLELTEVNSSLGALLAPLLLGTAGAAYLASAGTLAAKGGLLLLADRAKEFVLANTQGVAVAGVAATVAVGTTLAVTLPNNDTKPQAEQTAPATSTLDAVRPSTPAAPKKKAKPPRRVAVAPPAPVVTDTPSTPVTTPNPPPPAQTPSQQPTQQPSQTPTEEPTEEPTETPTLPPVTPTEPTSPPTTNPPTSTDLRLTATAVRDYSGATITVATTGYPAGRTAILRIVSTSPLGLTANLPGYCHQDLLSQVATCELSAARPGFTGRVTLGPWETVTYTVTPVGFTDPDSSNNSWSFSAR